MCFDCSTDWPFPHLFLLSLGLPITEIRPIDNPTMVSKCSSEEKSHMSFTFNQKLAVIKISEEGVSKAKTVWKLGLK